MTEQLQNMTVRDVGAVRIFGLNRPEKKNAINAGLARDWVRALELAADDDTVRVVVITGEGDYYSAGADLNGLGNALDAESEPSPAGRLDAIVLNFPKPIIAAVNGPAVGMAVTLLAHFDMVYAADTATFSLPFVKLGLVMEYGSSFHLPRLIGRQRAAEMALRAKPLDAATAAEWGLVTRMFPRAGLMDEVLAIARDVAANGAQAVQTSRLLLRAGEERTRAEATQAEWAALDDCFASDEHRAAIAAFLTAKRSK